MTPTGPFWDLPWGGGGLPNGQHGFKGSIPTQLQAYSI